MFLLFQRSLRTNKPYTGRIALISGLVFICVNLFLSACAIAPPQEYPAITTQPEQRVTSPTTILPTDASTSPLLENLPITELPQASPTSLPTQTATPTPEPAASAWPPTNGLETTPLQETSDLLYISDGKLQRWDHVTNYTHALADYVDSFSVSANGKLIALMRSRNMVANGVELFDLALLDFDTKQITTLVEATPRLSITISPDGAWIAYSVPGDDPTIYALQVAAPQEPIEIGPCNQEPQSNCEAISWSPDSRSLLWGDELGIWTGGLDGTAPQLLLPNQVDVYDPQGETMLVEVRYTTFSWSPDGRYVLAELTPWPSGLRWLGILDTRRIRLIAIPGTLEAAGAGASGSWLPDGSLLVAQSSNPINGNPPILIHWQVVDTHDDLLIEQESFVVPLDDLPAPGSEVENGSDHCLNWLSQTGVYTYTFGASLGNEAAMLFQLNLEVGELQKLFELPLETTEVLWSPDGGGVLITVDSNQVFFVLPRSGKWLDLLPVLGPDPHHFFWLPPAPRS